MGEDYKEIVNWCVNEYKSVMIECCNGKVFLLWKHHRFIFPERESKRIYVGKIKSKDSKLKYYYETFEKP